MSYLALARKYRPQTFSEVLSQDFITSTLQNAINLGRVSHAYLFTGPRGVGKTSTARIFAKALNCLNPGEGGPCGECENCQEITSGTSLDVIEIDGASNRGVEEIRSLREAVKFVPVKSKYKVIIVDEVHMLTEQAFNALLKTLEEPPEYVIFIFATTDQHKIPVTILSRCQRYEFKKISYDEMNKNLENILNIENITYEKDALNYIIRNSDGCMRDALSLLDQVIAYSGGNITLEETSYLLGISDAFISNNIFSAVLKEEASLLPDIIEQIDERGIDYKYMTECLIEHTRNMLFIAVAGKAPSVDMTGSEIEFYTSLKPYADKGRIYALFQIFQKLSQDLKYSDFARYVFEFAVFKAANLSDIINILSSDINTVKAVKVEQTSAPKKVVQNEEVTQNISQTKQTEVKQQVVENKQSNTDEESNGIWVRVLNYISSKNTMLFGLLQSAEIVKDTKEHIIINFPQDRQFQYKNIKNGPMHDTFEQMVYFISETHTKIDVELSGELQEKKTENLAEKKTLNNDIPLDNKDNKSEKQVVKASGIESVAVKQLREKYMSNEFVRKAYEDFGSEIIRIEKE